MSYVPTTTRARAMRASFPGFGAWLSGALLIGTHFAVGPTVGVVFFVSSVFFGVWGCLCAILAARNPRLGAYRPYVVAFDASFAVAFSVFLFSVVS